MMPPRDAFAVAIICQALACGTPDPGARGPLARRTLQTQEFSWRVVDLPDRRMSLYLQKGTAADSDATLVADSTKKAQADVLAMLGEPLRPVSRGGEQGADTSAAGDATLFLVGSRDAMRRISGRPLAGFVQPGEPTAFFVWSRGYRAPLRHELAHLYTFNRWGAPAARDSAAWLVEGIGVWAGGPCQGHSADALAADLLRTGRLPTIQQLATTFRALPEEAAMPAAGSLTEFLYSREGIAGLRRRWAASAREQLPDDATEAAWRAHVQSIRPESLDVRRVMREGC